MNRKDAFVPGEYYHIFNRGVDKRNIFTSAADYRRFIMLLYVANSTDPIRLDNLLNVAKISYPDVFTYERPSQLVSIGAWCLMTNHFHLLIREKSEGGIPLFMQKLGTGYSMYFNIKHERRGALFESRFKSRFVSEDKHLKHLFGYIHLNPLDIKFSGWKEQLDKSKTNPWQEFLVEYPYSSYHDLNHDKRPERGIIDLKEFPEYFSDRPSFQDFVSSYLSDESFSSKV